MDHLMKELIRVTDSYKCAIKGTGTANQPFQSTWDYVVIYIYIYIYIYINIWKSSQRINLRDVGSETSVNDTVQTNKNDK